MEKILFLDDHSFTKHLKYELDDLVLCVNNVADAASALANATYGLNKNKFKVFAVEPYVNNNPFESNNCKESNERISLIRKANKIGIYVVPTSDLSSADLQRKYGLDSNEYVKHFRKPYENFSEFCNFLHNLTTARLYPISILEHLAKYEKSPIVHSGSLIN
jgi:hypothetical protein